MLIAPERECPLHIVESLPCVLRRTHSPENALSFFRKGNLSHILPKPVVLQKKENSPRGRTSNQFFQASAYIKKNIFRKFWKFFS